MRLTALAGLFALTIIFANSPKVHAETLDINTLSQQSYLVAFEPLKVEKPKTETTVSEPEIHVVVPGESLISIAGDHKTTWQRIYDKNLDIADPNQIEPGQRIVIPKSDEKLTERPTPVDTTNDVSLQPQSKIKARTASYNVSAASAPKGSSAGNTYGFGYCTWYAKNMRPDLPNNLGNANTWVSRAASQGFATGSVPRVGAIGQQGMHVVYVQSVNGDGTVTISEMNYAGWNVVSSRTVSASNFMYVY